MKIHPQIIVKNRLPIFVVLSYKEYENILNVLEESDDVEEIKEFHASKQTTVSHKLLQDIANGGHPVRVFRECRGLSQAKLASEAGISRQYLHQIEHRQRKGNAAVLKKIAHVLGIDLELLVLDDE